MCREVLPQSSAEVKQSSPSIHPARIQRMLDRAVSLYDDGYRAVEMLHELFRVTTPAGGTHIVDRRDWTCDCMAFQRRLYTDRQGRVTCKHLTGLRKLIADQRRQIVMETATQAAFAASAYRQADERVNQLIERMDSAITAAEQIYYARQCEDAEMEARQLLEAWEAVR